MAREKAQIPVVGWRDESPDLTLGEHDTVVAIILMAWADAAADLSKIRSKARYDEVLAYKISAYRFLSESRPSFPSRMSLKECCIVLDLDLESTRKAILATITAPPTLEMPSKWAEDLEDDRREDVVYQTRRRRKMPKKTTDNPTIEAVKLGTTAPEKLIMSLSDRLQDGDGIDFWALVAEEIAKDK